MKKINYLFTLLLALVICGNVWGKTITVGSTGADYKYLYCDNPNYKSESAIYASDLANGDVVKFIEDYRAVTHHDSYVCQSSSPKSITIDLNGHTFSHTSLNLFSGQSAPSNVFSTAGGVVQITFAGVAGSKIIMNGADPAIRFYNSTSSDNKFIITGNIEIDAAQPFGVYSTAKGQVEVAAGATLTINGNVTSAILLLSPTMVN